MTEFRGRLKALSFADILEFLRVLNRPGLLSLSVEGTTIGLYLRDGRIVHGASTRESDRLSDLLLRRGTITRDQCDQAMRRAAAGEKLGKALVDRGGLTPRALMEARLHQVQQMAVSLFEWEDGDFVFLESEAPQDEGVEVDLPIATVLVEGLRSVRNLALFRKSMKPREDLHLDTLEKAELKADGPGAIEEILAEVSKDRLVAARKTIALVANFPNGE